MRIAMYVSVVILFITTVAIASIVYSLETTTLASAAVNVATVSKPTDDSHHNDQICENFNALITQDTAKTFDSTVTYAIDQNKHKYEVVSTSYSSTYNPKDMTTKEKVEYLLRCNKANLI